MSNSHTESTSLPDGLSDHELTYQLIQLETRFDLRIGDVPAAQIIRAACRRIELKNRSLGAARELLEEWMLASDNFDMEAWALRVRNMLEGSNPFNTEIEAKRAALMTARADVEDRLRQAKSDVQMFQRRLEDLYFEIEALDALSDDQKVRP